MATKEWGSQPKIVKAVDEIFFQNEAASLCLLVNRRARIVRVIDFRAGPTNAKRLFVLSLAQREGARKVYTVVERDEVQTWLKLGFVKEGNIPGFYKRSDAFILGLAVPPPGGSHAVADGREPSMHSETRIAVAEPGGAAPTLPESHVKMERTIVLAKRAAKELAGRTLPQAKVAVIAETEARKAVTAALRSGHAITAFEPFGRDVARRYFVVMSRGSRGGFPLHASTESQACFGNSYLELLRRPRTDAELLATTAALRSMCERLLSEDVVSCFALSPTDDVSLATAFVHNGFRRTGLLADHLVVGSERKDAILWSRKMANPAEE
jgi:hypothetical protein